MRGGGVTETPHGSLEGMSRQQPPRPKRLLHAPQYFYDPSPQPVPERGLSLASPRPTKTPAGGKVPNNL